MIVLHSPKIIAIKGIKVAGTSFEIALSKFAKRNDIITPVKPIDEKLRESFGFRGAQNYRYTRQEIDSSYLAKVMRAFSSKNLPKKFFSHTSCVTAKGLLGEDIWNSYTKIAILRNPFDCIVSRYFWEKKTFKDFKSQNFEDFILNNPQKIIENRLIYSINGCNSIDTFIRYDSLHHDLEALERSFPELDGISDLMKKISTKSDVRPKNSSSSEMFAEAPVARKVVESLCWYDLKKYNFDVPS